MLLQKLSSNKVDYSQVKDKRNVIKNSTSKWFDLILNGLFVPSSMYI